MWIVMGGVMLFGIRNPDFRAGFESSMYVKGVSVDSYVLLGLCSYVAVNDHDERCSFFNLSICQINC